MKKIIELTALTTYVKWPAQIKLNLGSCFHKIVLIMLMTLYLKVCSLFFLQIKYIYLLGLEYSNSYVHAPG